MNPSIGSIIKENRQQKGYSQERLAELAQINLRTVQRIERGETEARGDTLNRIASALAISIEELTLAQITIETAKEQNNNYLALMNLSGLLFLLGPFGLLMPVILWLFKKDNIRDIATAGKSILNFQLTFTICSYIIWGITILFKLNHWYFVNVLLIARILMAIKIYMVTMIILNTIRLAQGKPTWYRPAYRFFKIA